MIHPITEEQIRFIKDNRTIDHVFILKALVDRHTHQGVSPWLGSHKTGLSPPPVF